MCMESQPVAIHPVERATGSFLVPGSKSLSARSIVAAALAQGTSVLEGCLFCEDTNVLAQAFTGCGIIVSFDEDAAECTVSGLGGDFPSREGRFFLGNAGTAMRFLTAVLTVAEGAYELEGTDRMHTRPIGKLVDALNLAGAAVSASKGCPPVTIGCEHLRGGKVRIPGTESSQFISALLLAAPYSREGLSIEVTGKVVSKPYLDLTCQVMEAFGCSVEISESPLVFSVKPGRYTARTWRVEPDASSASYFAAAAAVTGGSVELMGLGSESKQGDMQFLDVLEQMGCTVEKGPGRTKIEGGALAGVSVDAASMPDMVPTIAAVALFAEGTTEISGVPHLRIKESDRIHTVAVELGKFGPRIEERDDGLIIRGGGKPSGAVIDTWNDHRIAMAAAVAGLKAPGTVIRNPRVVNKSFPGFFKMWRRFS